MSEYASPRAKPEPLPPYRGAASEPEPITLELPDMVGGTVAVVTLNPGDTLVLTCPQPMSRSMAERIHETVTAYLPGIQCMVMDNGMSLGGVIRREEPEVTIFMDPRAE